MHRHMRCRHPACWSMHLWRHCWEAQCKGALAHAILCALQHPACWLIHVLEGAAWSSNMRRSLKANEHFHEKRQKVAHQITLDQICKE